MIKMLALYEGRRGAGKTLSMTKDLLKFFLDGWDVFSNFHTSFSTFISNEELLSIDKNSTYQNCVFAVDEIQIFFDSRNSNAKENRRFSNFIQQLRKRNIPMLASTQFTNTIDKRLRQHLDVLVRPVCVDKENHIFKNQYIELPEGEVSYSSFFYALPFYDVYDTLELL